MLGSQHDTDSTTLEHNTDSTTLGSQHDPMILESVSTTNRYRFDSFAAMERLLRVILLILEPASGLRILSKVGKSPRLTDYSRVVALFELSFVASLKTLRRRWTVNLYWRSCFKTNNDETRFSGTELGVDMLGLRCTPGNFGFGKEPRRT